MGWSLSNLHMSNTTSASSAGISFGCALAIAISYAANKSIGWAIVHGILSWFFVIYAALTYK
jgi:hypothetical protein